MAFNIEFFIEGDVVYAFKFIAFQLYRIGK